MKKTDNQTTERRETIRDVRDKAYALIAKGISNKEQFREAMPVLDDLRERVKQARSLLTQSADAEKALSERCSTYVLEHPSVFKQGQLVESQRGVLVGDVVIDGVTYHFANGYDGYERTEGGNMSQDFLATLPVEWRKEKLAISTTGIEASNPTAKQLERYKLKRKVKNEWSRGSTVSDPEEDL